MEKELLIQEKEKLYMELKQILARQPGPEVAEQLSIYQQTLKEKTKQMKGMSSELNMYEAQVKEYKYEIERLAKELQEVKKKFYMQKRKDQQARCSTHVLYHEYILNITSRSWFIVYFDSQRNPFLITTDNKFKRVKLEKH